MQAICLLDENEKVLKDYENYLISKGVSRRTIIDKLAIVRVLDREVKKKYKEMSSQDIEKFIAELYNKGVKESSLNIYKLRIKQFFRWLYNGDEEGEVPEVVKSLKLSKVKKQYRNKVKCCGEEILEMARYAGCQRDRAMVLVCYEGALRASELLNLKIKHVRFDKYGATIIVKGKTGERRVRLIDSTKDLQLWLDMHPQRDNPEAWLWVRLDNPSRRIGYQRFYYILKGLAKKAGLKEPPSPHALRHCRLTEMAQVLTENELKVYAGWTQDSGMAAVYVHLSGEDIDAKLLEKAGVEVEKEEKKVELKSKVCPRCGERNSPLASYCFKCSQVLDERVAFSLATEKSGEIEELKKEIYELKKVIKNFAQPIAESSPWVVAKPDKVAKLLSKIISTYISKEELLSYVLAKVIEKASIQAKKERDTTVAGDVQLLMQLANDLGIKLPRHRYLVEEPYPPVDKETAKQLGVVTLESKPEWRLKERGDSE